MAPVALPARLDAHQSPRLSGLHNAGVFPVGPTSIGAYAFRNCTSLASVELPAGLTTIGGGAFVGSVTPPAFPTATRLLIRNE